MTPSRSAFGDPAAGGTSTPGAVPLHELYALSLTIGTCLDPQTVCKDFVGALLRCLGLGYAGVWVTPAGRGQSPDPGFELVFETPPIPGTSYTPPPSPPTSLGSDAGCIFFDASSRSTADLGQNEGRCATGAWLPLGELGWLEIQRSAPPIAEVELSALLPLVARFAVALQAAFWTARRTQSEPAASSGEARFVAMAEQSADWIWILDTRGRHTYSNGRTREILGYSRDEFLAADPLDLVHPDDHAVFLATFQGAVARRTGWQNVLLRWRHRDGSYRVLESNASAVLDEGGQLVEFQGVDRDVTDRASREQASHRLAAIVEHSLDFIGIADVEGHIQVVNPAGRALVGLEPLEDIKSKRIPDFVHESSRGLFADQVTPVVLQTGHWQGELCFRNLRTGAAVSVLSDVFRIDGSDGRPLHMATVSRDIRERKRSEELLDRHNRLLRSVAAGSAILVTERSEQGMMSAICRILVEQGRYRMAWIGRVGPEGARVLPVASAGARTDYLATVDIRCDDSPLAAGPTGTAIRTNRSVVIDDLAADARFAPWREVALSAAFLSSAATPLRVQGQVIGALNVYSGELAAFRPDELVLLEKLAADLGSALERQRAETALRDSEARFRLLLDSTAEAIYGVDTNGTCIFVNPACLRMLGYAREEDLIGRNLHALIHHTTADGRPYPKEQCPVRCSTLQGKPTHVADEVQWRADGSCFPVEYWSHPMYRDGELLGAVVTFLDITERRRAEQALRASEARYRLISSVTSDMPFSCVRGDGGMLAIDWAAGSVQPIFGCSIEELKAQDCWRCFVHPADLHIFDRHIGALRPGQSSQCELRIVHRDGSTR